MHMLQHNRTAKYPVRRVETTVIAIPEGHRTSNQHSLFLGELPETTGRICEKCCLERKSEFQSLIL